MKRSILTAVFFACTLAGCAARVQHVIDLPAGVTEQQAKDWDSAVANLHKIAATTSTLRKSVIALRNDGVFPNDDAYASALQVLGKIDQIQVAASDLLRQQPKAFGQPQRQQIALYMQMVSAELKLLNTAGATGIKNADSRKQFDDLVSEITGLAGLVLNLTF